MQKSGAFIVKLVVSPVDGLLVDGFTALNVRCVYASEDITLTLPAGVDGKHALLIRFISTKREEDVFSGTHDMEAGVVTGSGGAPLLSMQILDGHGLDGPPLQKAGVGQRLTLDLVLKDTGKKTKRKVKRRPLQRSTTSMFTRVMPTMEQTVPRQASASSTNSG